MAQNRGGERVELSRGGRLVAGRAKRGRKVPMQLSIFYIPDTQEPTATQTLQGEEKCINIQPVKVTPGWVKRLFFPSWF